LELHKQKKESGILVTLLWGVLVLHDIKLPNRTDTIPVLDSENKPTFLYELSPMIIFVKSIKFSDIYNTKCTTVYKDERTQSV